MTPRTAFQLKTFVQALNDFGSIMPRFAVISTCALHDSDEIKRREDYFQILNLILNQVKFEVSLKTGHKQMAYVNLRFA